MVPKEEKRYRKGTNRMHCEQMYVRRREGAAGSPKAVLVEYADLAKQVTYVCHQELEVSE